MTSRNDKAPAVVAYADHEVITPPNLRTAIVHIDDGDDPVARAEAALARLSSEFADWMHAECERLEAARQDIRRGGLDARTHGALFRASHDVKGEAATFGYPEAAIVADSLCRLLEHTPQMARIPLALVEQHVDAVRAIAREHNRTDLATVASALTQRLRDVTDEFLRAENSERPEYLESIFAPPLAAGAPDEPL
jgi:HPt (histidine-containing phosphotransfer) domain-containing protein